MYEYHARMMHHAGTVSNVNPWAGFWLLVLLVALVVLVIAFWKDPKKKDIKDVKKSNALLILEDRFAKGEITNEEFESKKALLK